MKRIILIVIIFCLYFPFLCAQKSESGTYYLESYTGKDAENNAKEYLENREYPQPIEGIWQSSDGFTYFISKDSENGETNPDIFRMIVLESSHEAWDRGDIKGRIRFGSVDNVYSLKYYMKNRYTGEASSMQVVLVYENDALMSFVRIDSNEKIMLYRLYPSANAPASNTIDDEKEDDKQWSGSGIVIAPNYVATNFHVVDEAKSLCITNVDGNKNVRYNVDVVAVDKFNDLAILKVNDNLFKSFQTIDYGFNTAVKDLGTDVFVLGYPLISTMGEDIKLTNGIISSKTGFQGDVSLYQISAPIQPGNSGGPLFDYEGNLIGIVNAKHMGAENVGYAIKLSYLQNLIESSNVPVKLESTNVIKDFSLAAKIKEISPNVVCIKANIQTHASVNSSKQRVSSQTRPSDIAKAEKLFKSAYNSWRNDLSDRAYREVKQSVDLYPTFTSVYMYGRLSANRGDTIEAFNAFEYCLSKHSQIKSDYYCYWMEGLVHNLYDEQKNPTGALDLYNRILNRNPDCVDCYFSKGICKSQLNQLEECIYDYQEFLKYETQFESVNFPTAYNNIAFAYLELGEIEKAKPYIEKALKKRTILDFIWDTDGEYAYKTGDYLRCINSMNNAISISKSHGELSESRINSYKYRGLAYLQIGDTIHAYYDLNIAKEDSSVQRILSSIKAQDTSFVNESVKIVKPHCVSMSKFLTIESIEITSECTKLNLSFRHPQSNYYSISEHTILYDKSSGTTLPILSANNCAFSGFGYPTIIQPNDIGKRQYFTLYFPRIPDSIKEVNFIEPGESDWKMNNIKLK